MRRRLLFAVPALVSCAAVLGIEDRSVSDFADASVQSGQSDGGPTEGPSDARETSTGDGGLGACTPGSTTSFCDDFESTPLDDRWSAGSGGGATIQPVNGALSGRSRIIELRLPATPDSLACMTRAIPTALSQMTLAVDIRIAAVGSGSLDLLRIGEPGQPNIELEINAKSELLLDDETLDSNNKRTPLGLSLETGTWTRVELRFVVTAADAVEVTATVKGASGATVTTARAAPLTSRTVYVSLGDCASGTAIRWNALYDDLVVLGAE